MSEAAVIIGIIVVLLTAILVSNLYVLCALVRIEGFLVRAPCPHGFTDWDECPDCCH